MFVHCQPRHKHPAFWRELSVGASSACVFFQLVEQENDVLSFSARGLWRQSMNAPTSPLRPTSARAPCFANSCLQASDRRRPSARYLPIKHLPIVLCVIALLVLPTGSSGQEGHHGVGHESWHESFYSTLVRKDTKTSCCNLSDCRPTEARMVNDHYEVKVDGAWLPVPKEAIQNISAPDGGAHVCAPPQVGATKGKVYCVVLPPET